MLQYIVQIFEKLPDTSKAAIIASVVTFIGLSIAAMLAFLGGYITHRGHERRFRKQLRHDLNQKRIEREMALRKEVYLDAAEAIIAGLGVINRYRNLNIPQEELEQEYSKRQGALAKIHLIGTEATVTSISKFSVELRAAITSLSLQRRPLLKLQARNKLLDDQIRSSGQERDRMIELMKELNYTGNFEEHRWKFVKETFEFEQGRVKEAIEEKESINLKIERDWNQYAIACYEAYSNVSKLLMPAVKAIREELGLPFDVENYNRLFEENLQREGEIFKEFLNGIERARG